MLLSLFPNILFLAPFSASLLRFALAAVLGYAAYRHVSTSAASVRLLSFVEAALAALLFVGAWTQAAGLVSMIFVGLQFFVPRLRAYATGTLLLAFVLCASLVVTGAGAIAFDLPL